MKYLVFGLSLLTLCHGSPWFLKNYDDLLQRQPIGDEVLSDPKHDFSIDKIIINQGYPLESHTVLTRDGYILKMHRIPHGKNSSSTSNERRPAIYLQHGLLGSSVDWVMGCPEKSLGYLLADAGYDVWLGNFRGNTYSRNHASLDPLEKNFWKFSWDEMGMYDIPSMIEKVLEVTGHEKLFYLGYSMGTTGFMVMANHRPDLLEKVVMASLLAPVAYVDHMKSPIRLMAPFVNSLQWVISTVGKGEFLPNNWLMDVAADLACPEKPSHTILCESILFLLAGFDEAQLNQTLLHTIVHHAPAGTSSMTVAHYAQEVNSKLFQAYDYGKSKNTAIYGQSKPPEYRIDAVTVPTALYWGSNDWLADPKDVARLLNQLPNIVNNYRVPFEEWNHLDFIWGIDAFSLVYRDIFKTLEKFLPLD